MLRMMLLLMMSRLATAAYYVRISRPAESRLHILGKQTVNQHQHTKALTYYQTAADHGSTSKSHLLLVLHLQRCGACSEEEIRDAFRKGVKWDPSNAKLLQAWALYESKNDNMHRAVFLLRRAARMDPASLPGALRWKRFREYNRVFNPLAGPSKRGLAVRGCSEYEYKEDFDI